MKISQIRLQHFRNYQEQEINFCDGVNVVYGNNAQGKTNLLEAVYLFSNAKSLRQSRDREMISFGQEHARLTLFFDAYERENRAELELFHDRRKKVRLNGVALNRLGRMIGYFNTVLFCPEDLYLIKGGPSERRKFLDNAISPLKPNYFTVLMQYHKILENKNRLLKELFSDPQNEEMLSVWNQKLCETGARIMLYRAAFVRRLNELAGTVHSEITKNTEELLLRYHPSVEAELESEPSIREAFWESLTRHAARERAAGMSLCGPHRDDIDFYINGTDVKSYASQGQQRTVVLTMKMAQVELVRQAVGEYPVLLLDDILSELDRQRQEYLLGQIQRHQVLITCTDAHVFTPGEHKRFFRVEDGSVVRTD